MTVRNLKYLLDPKSVALIGASQREGSVGYWIARNLLDGDFPGDVHFVNPRHDTILGHPSFASIVDLPEGVDLAVIATPARTVPDLVQALVSRGVRAIVCISAGLCTSEKQRILNASQPTCMRMLGPNSVGLLLPQIGLNASFAHRNAPAGDIAFVSQSGALVTTIIDWAADRQIGFSHVLSMGDMTDVDFGDVIDYLAADTASRAILLYMEGLTDARKFMSAARRAARSKPVVVVKSGRNEAGSKAAMSHTGALAGTDAAYDAAFRRAGLLRVPDLEQLFEAAEVLRIAPRLHGERLTVLTNGGGAGVLAVDRLADLDGTLAQLSENTIGALNAFLPAGWSGANPIDIIGDSNAERYAKSLEILLADNDCDAILVMNCPTALASGEQIAKTLVEQMSAKPRTKPVLTNWLGDTAAKPARRMFEANGVPTFETPGEAVRGFMHLVQNQRAQDELLRAPPASVASIVVDRVHVDEILSTALSASRYVLSATEAKSILASYGIAMVEAATASDVGALEKAATDLLAKHEATALKILSDDISHKSDVGGVRLGLRTVDEVAAAANEMMGRISEMRPDARLDGFTLEPMVIRPRASELIVGMSVDPTFGPMIMFGAGGTSVEVVKDTSMALPPLDLKLARTLMARTRVHRLLEGYRDRPAADTDAIARTLVRISELVIAHPEIREIDINPLLADETGIIGVDARMRIADPNSEPRVPTAIRPYPSEWSRRITNDALGEILVRPIRPEDEHLASAFANKLTERDIRLRLFAVRKDFSHAYIARLTQIDYAREMAFVALTQQEDEVLGVVRMIADPDGNRAEYALIVRSDLKGKGLGWSLMQHVINYARHEGLNELFGTVLAENVTMLRMCRELGFDVSHDPDDRHVMLVTLELTPS